MKSRFDAFHLIRTSALAREVFRNRRWIQKRLNSENRRVWPVAKVARIFGVSERLLWNWIESGLLRTQRPQPFHKRGISKPAAVRFLKLLEKEGDECGFGDYGSIFGSPAGRPDIAMRKIRRAWHGSNGLTPCQFAGRAGVSRTTVMRAIHDGDLNAWNPTPRRYVLGRRPRFGKKFKKTP